MALGGILVVVAFSYMYLMITMPERATFDPDHFVVRATEREPPPSPLGWIISLFLVGAGIVIHGALSLYQRARIPTAAPRPRAGDPQALTLDRAAVPKALLYLPGVGYRAFVAWRYLLVYHHRISVRVKLLFLGLLTFRIVLWLVLDVGARVTDIKEPLQALGAATHLAIWCVVFFGVLRYSKLATIVFVLGLVITLTCGSIETLAGQGKLPLFDFQQARQIQQLAGIAKLFGGVLSFLAAFFGVLRGFFTFFTTVPIGGVWIGTSALVVVLAVMSGFETDLRDKILGSNAHIQVTREDGDFVEWREVKAKIDKVDGVVASTPYAVSEVVIAANNNGMNVIIKGIDPATVGNVTDLVTDIEGVDEKEKLETMKRLAPLIDLGHDRSVPATTRPKDAPDPVPDDMVTGGDPIDFSGGSGSSSGSGSGGSGSGSVAPRAGSGSGSAGSASAGSGSATGSIHDSDGDSVPVSPYGGDARYVVSDTDSVLDALDSDLIRWMVGEDRPGITVVDVPTDPAMSRRTQALPGILVGRELVKQTHLYTGEEVRVVSPLSDPSNPDATGTPIPFNRDYRVAGVFYTGMYEYDLKFVYVSLDSLQDFLDLGDTVDGIEVRLESADDTDRYVPHGDDPGLIRRALGEGYRVQDWHELNRSLFSALKLEKIAMFLVLGIVILVASFSIIGNLIMVVVEKGREIALLKTLGASDIGVMQMFAVQGLIIGLIGTTLGISFGLLGCYVMDKFGLGLNPDVYYIDRLPIHVDPQSVVAAAITGVLISIAATLYPALMAARVRPAIGMRH